MRSFVIAIMVIGVNIQVHARESFEFGTESYRWSEYDSVGAWLLTESGQHQYIGYQKIDQDASGITSLYGRFFFGDVFYDGQLMDGTPYTSTTGYSGFNLEQKRQFIGGATPEATHAELGLGLDFWQRLLDKGGTTGYLESYLSFYARAGLGYGRADSGWYGSTGIRYPLTVNETAYISPYDDIHLNPVPRFNLYAELGYAYPAWGWALYYDGYRFERSPQAVAAIDGVPVDLFVQPRSEMDRVGVRFSLRF